MRQWRFDSETPISRHVKATDSAFKHTHHPGALQLEKAPFQPNIAADQTHPCVAVV